MPATQPIPPVSALVARTNLDADAEHYLLVTPAGRTVWVEDPQTATSFTSMREATRMAMRLPSGLRAFGLPLETELAVRRAH